MIDNDTIAAEVRHATGFQDSSKSPLLSQIEQGAIDGLGVKRWCLKASAFDVHTTSD
jgi:hypothetical protein